MTHGARGSAAPPVAEPRDADPPPVGPSDHERPALEPGAELAAGLRLLERLGGGDRYEAWIAWDDRLLVPVVAKLLRPELRDDPRALGAIAREAHALHLLEHPVLVRSFGSHLDGTLPYLVLEFLDGPRLSTLLRRHGPLSIEQVVLMARQLAAALHYMGHEGWVHLDVKPRNVIMTASPRLIDLSVARPIRVARGTTGVGTDAYMAPEQILPERSGEIGPPSDVFGLGATLLEALTGRQPFPASRTERHPQLRPDRPPLPEQAPSLLRDLVAATLDDRPDRRPTAAAVHDALDGLAEWAHRSIRRLR